MKLAFAVLCSPLLCVLVIPAKRFTTAEGWSSRNPVPSAFAGIKKQPQEQSHWIPAFAGMTSRSRAKAKAKSEKRKQQQGQQGDQVTPRVRAAIR
jgi:hypothetical protein